MIDTQFYQDLLALPGLHVTAVETGPQRIDVHGALTAMPAPCPVCGIPTAIVNQYETRHVQDLSISGKEVWLHLRVPQLACTSCPRYFMARFGFRGLRQYLSAQREGGRRVLLYGDDHASMLLLRYLRRRSELSMTPVGLLYDNSDQQGFTVQGLSVVGTPDNLSEICAAYDVEGVVIASPPVDRAHRMSLTRLCKHFGLSCYYIDLTVHSSQLLPEIDFDIGGSNPRLSDEQL